MSYLPTVKVEKVSWESMKERAKSMKERAKKGIKKGFKKGFKKTKSVIHSATAEVPEVPEVQGVQGEESLRENGKQFTPANELNE